MANVSVKQKINASISGKRELTGSINRNETVSGNVNVGQVYTQNVDEYTGDYDVTPKAIAQVLETKQKLMTDDVRIRKIPFHEVSNPHGGTTITIGKDI